MKLHWDIFLVEALLSVASAKPPTCVDGVYMISARGSTEPPGPGSIGDSLGPLVKGLIPSSAIEGVPYPAVLNHYNDSVHAGVLSTKKLVEEYVDHCGSKHVIVLFGYSQGAQVIGDAMCGSIEQNVSIVPALTPKYQKQVLAAIQMGDPTFVPDLTWDRGNSTHHGLFPRPHPNKTCGAYNTRILSYCDQFDFACASGKSLAVHLSYLGIYKHDAVQFVKQRWDFYQKNGYTVKPAPSGGSNPGNGGGNGGGNSGGNGGNGAGSTLTVSKVTLWFLATLLGLLLL